MANIPLASAMHRPHPLSRRANAFKLNRNLNRSPFLGTAHLSLVTEGQPRLTKRIAQLAAILLMVLLTSLGAVLGFFPELNTDMSSAGSTASGATRTPVITVPTEIIKLPLTQQIARLDRSQTSPLQRAELYNALGVSYLAGNDCKSAEICFTKALYSDPSFIAANNNLGSTLLASGNCSRARVAFEKTLVLQPTNAYAKSQLSRLK